MQKKTKVFLAAGAAGLIALGAAAGLASADMGHGMGDGMRGGGYGMMGGWGGHRGMGGMAMQMMERYDANKDGKLSQDEIDTNRTQWLNDFDADKNGSLSLEEFQNLWLKARHEQMVREFQQFDRDGNGQVALDEYKGPMASVVADHDFNHDGVLSGDDRGRHFGRERGERMRWFRNGQGMGQGQGMGRDMGPGMMDDDEGESEQ